MVLASTNNNINSGNNLIQPDGFHVPPLVHEVSVGPGVDGEDGFVLLDDFRPFLAELGDSRHQRRLLLFRPHRAQVVRRRRTVPVFCLSGLRGGEEERRGEEKERKKDERRRGGKEEEGERRKERRGKGEERR